ncbi:MAG: Peptidoglycan glycosyltransferase [candidate division WWE3 bacterium GW2011_GWB1_44_4]|uniref:Peptidoglycan glycosyltransferase n=1 Tax=candidate division WWE3 bacterium GW2011_GWB1_44_4 TaxID=1619116 RepID=A0A0G1M9E5_UNCKA|nr:MAG: Peptidoglycan glycosyltransferase [candidate division WWE3 bacterium GW2011_GWB1_44_4]
MFAQRLKKSCDQRFFVLRLIILLLSFISAVRLFQIQILDHARYKARAFDQYSDLSSLPARRGEILTADGYPLASNQTSYLVYAEPKKISNKSEVLEKISSVLPEAEREKQSQKMLELLNLDLYWVALVHNLTPKQRDQLAQLNIAGIGFEEEPVRFYPEGTLAAHVLGFVAEKDTGEKGGYFGIEAAFDGELKGKHGKVLEERDALGSSILAGGFLKVAPDNGKDVYLTLDRTVQYIIEQRLREGVEQYDAADGVVIVSDPLDGSILGMATFPTYDPSDLDFAQVTVSERSGRKSHGYKNLAISALYEPGSVMKPLTVSSAIDHFGQMNIILLLQKSNNIGAAWVGHLVGSERLAAYFSRYGIGGLSGIDLEGEETGTLRPYKDWTDIDLATASFGQGILASPLQVLYAFNVFANGGILYKPRIVAKIVSQDKASLIPAKEVGRVVKKETADIVSDLLVKAVEGGESKYFNIKNYVVAGKTGTAQIAVAGGYDPTKTNATFVGYLPASKKFSMIVKLREPQTSPYAAETAVPLWMTIAEDLAKYFSIPPDK